MELLDRKTTWNWIFAVMDPRDYQPKYVGHAAKPHERLRAMWGRRNSVDGPLSRWMLELEEEERYPTLRFICQVKHKPKKEVDRVRAHMTARGYELLKEKD